MQTPFMLRRAVQALVPAVLLLSACGKDDDPVSTPVADTGRIVVSHAAAATNTALTVFVNDQQGGALNYGQTGSYFSINAGTPTLSIRNGTQVVTSQSPTIAKDQSYSAFIYSPTATIGSAALLTIPDNLTTPTVGTAKVRIVHLGVGAASPVRLSIPAVTPTGSPNDLTTDVAFGAASPFVEVNAQALSLSVLTASTPRTQVVAVGDGTGTGTGTKTFENGKIYTIVVRGISGTGVPAAQQIQAVIVPNN